MNNKQTIGRWLRWGCIASAALFAACSDDDDNRNGESNIIKLAATVESPATRAQPQGVIDYTVLKKSDQGFGVFSNGFTDTEWNNLQVKHYSDNNQASNPIDEEYTYPGNWKYDNEKEWPKNTNVSFFAYAPYSTGEEVGITKVDKDDNGPYVEYTAGAKLSDCRDLLWGINATTGLPWLNATRESNNGTILFTFCHACAAIGFKVQAIVNHENNPSDLYDESDALPEGSKVLLKSITLTRMGEGSYFYNSGTLRLNNEKKNTPYWTDTENDKKYNSLSISGSEINSTILYSTILYPSDTGISEEANSQLAIEKTDDREQLFFLIPEDAPTGYTCKVEYVVIPKTGKTLNYTDTEDTKAINIGSQTINIDAFQLQGGVKYYINLVFSLHTVKFSVEAKNWDDTDVDLNTIVETGTSASSSLSRRR